MTDGSTFPSLIVSLPSEKDQLALILSRAISFSALCRTMFLTSYKMQLRSRDKLQHAKPHGFAQAQQSETLANARANILENKKKKIDKLLEIRDISAKLVESKFCQNKMYLDH